MKLKQVGSNHIATITQDIKECVVDYGKCPKCNTLLEKAIFCNSNFVWGRLHCFKCDWWGFQEGIYESVELDPLKEAIQNFRNKLNRKISSLKKATLKQ